MARSCGDLRHAWVSWTWLLNHPPALVLSVRPARFGSNAGIQLGAKFQMYAAVGGLPGNGHYWIRGEGGRLKE